MRNISRMPKKRTGAFYIGESDGLQPGDGIGNRQKFSESRISADDIGNRLTSSDINNVVRDDIGNSIGSAPTHQQSGILASFDARGKRRREPSLDSRAPGYMVGGVNPLVSGSQALISMFSKEEEKSEEPVRKVNRVQTGSVEQTSANNEPQESARPTRKTERGGESSDRWLKRLLEFDDDDARLENATQGDPKQKAVQARFVLSEIFEKTGVMAAIGTEIVSEPTSGRQSVLVSFEDIDLTVDANNRLSKVFSPDSLSLLALNFLVNKIVNRLPEDRVRVQIMPRNASVKVIEPIAAAHALPDVSSEDF